MAATNDPPIRAIQALLVTGITGKPSTVARAQSCPPKTVRKAIIDFQGIPNFGLTVASLSINTGCSSTTGGSGFSCLPGSSSYSGNILMLTPKVDLLRFDIVSDMRFDSATKEQPSVKYCLEYSYSPINRASSQFKHLVQDIIRATNEVAHNHHTDCSLIFPSFSIGSINIHIFLMTKIHPPVGGILHTALFFHNAA